MNTSATYTPTTLILNSYEGNQSHRAETRLLWSLKYLPGLEFTALMGTIPTELGPANPRIGVPAAHGLGRLGSNTVDGFQLDFMLFDRSETDEERFG